MRTMIKGDPNAIQHHNKAYSMLPKAIILRTDKKSAKSLNKPDENQHHHCRSNCNTTEKNTYLRPMINRHRNAVQAYNQPNSMLPKIKNLVVDKKLLRILIKQQKVRHHHGRSRYNEKKIHICGQ